MPYILYPNYKEELTEAEYNGVKDAINSLRMTVDLNRETAKKPIREKLNLTNYIKLSDE